MFTVCPKSPRTNFIKTQPMALCMKFLLAVDLIFMYTCTKFDLNWLNSFDIVIESADRFFVFARGYKMDSEKINEQRVVMKFFVDCGSIATETFEHLKGGFSESCLGKTEMFEWHKRFKSGRTSLGNDERTGQLASTRTDTNIELARCQLMNDHRVICKLIEENIGIPKCVVQWILTEDLHKKKVCAHFILHSLTTEQRD